MLYIRYVTEHCYNFGVMYLYRLTIVFSFEINIDLTHTVYRIKDIIYATFRLQVRPTQPRTLFVVMFMFDSSQTL